MEGVLDIQRDHVDMIKKTMSLLTKGGVLVFSNNLRRFKLDVDALADFDLENVSAATIDKDFSRNSKIHQCWHIRYKTLSLGS